MWTVPNQGLSSLGQLFYYFAWILKILVRMSITWNTGLWITIGHFYTALAIAKLPVFPGCYLCSANLLSQAKRNLKGN